MFQGVDAAQALVHFGQRGEQHAPVGGHLLQPGGAGGGVLAAHLAAVEQQLAEGGRQAVDRVAVEQITQRAAGVAGAAGQAQRGPVGAARHRHAVVGGHQVGQGTAHVRALRQHLGRQARFDLGHGQFIQPAVRQQKALGRVAHQHRQRVAGFPRLLTQVRQGRALVGHQGALLGQVLGRHGAVTHLGLDQFQHPLGQRQAVLGQGQAVLQIAPLQPGVGDAGQHREAHAVAVEAAGLQVGFGDRLVVAQPAPQVQLVAGVGAQLEAVAAGTAEGTGGGRAAVQGQAREQRRTGQLQPAFGLQHPGGGGAQIGVVAQRAGHQLVQFITAEALPPGRVGHRRAAVGNLILPLRRRLRFRRLQPRPHRAPGDHQGA